MILLKIYKFIKGTTKRILYGIAGIIVLPVSAIVAIPRRIALYNNPNSTGNNSFNTLITIYSNFDVTISRPNQHDDLRLKSLSRFTAGDIFYQDVLYAILFSSASLSTLVGYIYFFRNSLPTPNNQNNIPFFETCEIFGIVFEALMKIGSFIIIPPTFLRVFMSPDILIQDLKQIRFSLSFSSQNITLPLQEEIYSDALQLNDSKIIKEFVPFNRKYNIKNESSNIVSFTPPEKVLKILKETLNYSNGLRESLPDPLVNLISQYIQPPPIISFIYKKLKSDRCDENVSFLPNFKKEFDELEAIKEQLKKI